MFRSPHSPSAPLHTRSPDSVLWAWREPLLVRLGTVVLLILSLQSAAMLLHPTWLSPEIDWSRSALAWPELLVVAWVSWRLSRAGHPSALAWWMWSAGLACNLVGQTIWSVDDQLVFHHSVPFPNWNDAFYLLQYPFFFLAVALLPHASRLGSRLILVLDGLVVMAAATAISWYFILAPVYAATGLSAMGRTASLAYPLGDLFVLYGLTMTLLRPSRFGADRLVLGILIAAVLCLIVADTLAVLQVIYGIHVYRTGGVSDILWGAFSLLVAVAAVAQWRLATLRPPPGRLATGRRAEDARPWVRDLLAGLRLFAPILLALVASAVILLAAIVRTAGGTAVGGWPSLMVAFDVSFSLLLLVTVRQGIAFVEHARLRRELEDVRAEERAQRKMNRQKDAFLEIVSHELKTPLTSLSGFLELLARRFASAERQDADATFARAAIGQAQASTNRIARLVGDLLDESRLRDDRLRLQVAPCDLATVVRATVDEQRAAHPEREISMTLPPVPVLVSGDAVRLQQVLSQYLANALKFSRVDQPVAVTLETTGGAGRVAVHDEGPGVPLGEQGLIWDPFHRVEEIIVQSGSGVGLGIGLSLCRHIIEAHHGQVGIESAPGKGSTFWFRLPLADADWATRGTASSTLAHDAQDNAGDHEREA